jgi:FkbM family methyltransferase
MNNLIYDIGMHTGKDTEFYLLKGFNVVSVEANPRLVKAAEEKFKEFIETGRLTIINKAIASGNSEKIKFYINEDKDDWGTILPSWNRSMNSNYTSIEVETIQLENIIETYGMPYYMKIDIEGADVLCLKSLLKINRIPDFLSIESTTPNNLPNQQTDCLEILSHLNVLGYKKFKISDQSANRTIKCPNPPLEGNYVNATFGGDSSGLFGKELNSPAYTLDEVAKMYLAYFYEPKKSAPSLVERILRKLKLTVEEKNPLFHKAGWFDIHAIKE